VVAFIALVIVDVILVGIVFLVLKRRPKDAKLTWGEAFVGATFVWGIFLLSYAFVPHQFITMCDKDFGWRSDAFGIPTGPFYTWPIINGRHNLWAGGLTFFGHGRILVNEQSVRDILATNIYVIFMTTHFKLWVKAQDKSEKGKAEVVPVSPYGRPLVRKG